jgi:ABC-type arginine/histidine transport system permease subunit
VVGVLWPALRDNLACTSLAATLADVARNAKVLVAIARKVERPAD